MGKTLTGIEKAESREIHIRFWQEVSLKDQKNSSGRIPIGEGDLHANNPSPRCSGSKCRPSLAQATTAPMTGMSRRPDSACQADGEDFTLSTEEQRIVALIVAGCSNKDMARLFSLSESTIYRRTVRIIGKLSVSNKFELVLFAIDHRIFAGAQHEDCD